MRSLQKLKQLFNNVFQPPHRVSSSVEFSALIKLTYINSYNHLNFTGGINMSSIDRSQKSLKIGFTIAFLGLAGCAGSPPSNLGVQNNQLAPCPSSPNCVSSYTDSDDHKVEPWAFTGSQQQAHQKLIGILKAKNNVTITKDSANYVRSEFESNLMGFVDDVEFVIEDGAVQMRSASRLGYSDLGANRARIEELEKDFIPCCD